MNLPIGDPPCLQPTERRNTMPLRHPITSRQPGIIGKRHGILRSGRTLRTPRTNSIIAHGHTLEAVKRGNEARDYYAEQAGIPLSPKYSQTVIDKAEEALAIFRCAYDGCRQLETYTRRRLATM